MFRVKRKFDLFRPRIRFSTIRPQSCPQAGDRPDAPDPPTETSRPVWRRFDEGAGGFRVLEPRVALSPIRFSRSLRSRGGSPAVATGPRMTPASATFRNGALKSRAESVATVHAGATPAPGGAAFGPGKGASVWSGAGHLASVRGRLDGRLHDAWFNLIPECPACRPARTRRCGSAAGRASTSSGTASRRGDVRWRGPPLMRRNPFRSRSSQQRAATRPCPGRTLAPGHPGRGRTPSRQATSAEAPQPCGGQGRSWRAFQSRLQLRKR